MGERRIIGKKYLAHARHLAGSSGSRTTPGPGHEQVNIAPDGLRSGDGVQRDGSNGGVVVFCNN
jgi:hypothetical protein